MNTKQSVDRHFRSTDCYSFSMEHSNLQITQKKKCDINGILQHKNRLYATIV